MSVLSSTKINYSISEVSLGSSAMMTASSMYGSSDGDYETSSEFLSPRIILNETSEISRCSSNIVHTTNCNYVITSRSNSILFDKSKESIMSFESNRYIFTIKSDTCLTQQNTVISDLMNDILKASEKEPYESNLKVTDKESKISVKTENSPTPNTLNSSSIYNIDLNINSSVSLIDKNISNTASKISVRQKLVPLSSLQEMEKQDCKSLRESEYKTVENPSQNNFNTLLLKSKESLHSFYDYPSLETVPYFDKNQLKFSDKPLNNVSLQKLQSTQKSFISNCIKSILQIDNELQPLNLMLSRLLAEFRAMNLKSRLSYIYPSLHDSYISGDTNDYFVSKITDFKSVNRFPVKVTDLNKKIISNKNLQENLTPYKQKVTYPNILQFKKSIKPIRVSSLYHFNENQKNMELKHEKKTCQSFNYNHQISRDSFKDFPLCCSRPTRVNHYDSKTQSNHQESKCVSVQDSVQKDDISVCKFSNARCKKLQSAITFEQDTRERYNRKKLTNETSKLRYLQDEETEKSNCAFSCHELISLDENCSFFKRPPAFIDMDNSADSVLNNNTYTGSIMPFLKIHNFSEGREEEYRF